MYPLYQLPSFLATAVLLTVLLRVRARLDLPRLLVVTPFIAMLGSLWSLAEAVIGAERLQTILITLFPTANDPEMSSETRYLVDEVSIGPVYNLVSNLESMIQSIAWLLFSVALLAFARRRIRESQSRQFAPPVADV